MTEDEHRRRGTVLLGIARQSLCSELGTAATGSASGEASIDAGEDEWLNELGAVFVSLHRGRQLRGCVGSVEPTRPLAEDVRHNAVAAALRDPRFAPLEPEELDQIELEVTELTPLEAMTFSSEADALSQLRPGDDGILLEWKSHRATYLPQVWESLPTPELFLASLKKKAGLDADFWDPGVGLYRYSARHWSESELD